MIRGGGCQLPPSGITRIGAAPVAVLIIDSITDGAAGEPSQFTNTIHLPPTVRRQVQELPGKFGERSQQAAKPPKSYLLLFFLMTTSVYSKNTQKGQAKISAAYWSPLQCHKFKVVHSRKIDFRQKYNIIYNIKIFFWIILL